MIGDLKEQEMEYGFSRTKAGEERHHARHDRKPEYRN
jgi:hypothetical protein